MTANKPIPETESMVEEDFWQRVANGEVCVQHCSQCGENSFPPRLRCPQCYSKKWEFEPISGGGEVVGYTAIHRASHPRFDDELPIVSAVIQLPEGPRMMGKLDCDIDDLVVGDSVELIRDNLSNDDVRFVFERSD